jgi:hypothetical protein
MVVGTRQERVNFLTSANRHLEQINAVNLKKQREKQFVSNALELGTLTVEQCRCWKN